MMDDSFYYYQYFDPHDTILLVYDAEENVFYNELGCVIHDIYHFISPNQLYLFRKETDIYDEFVYTIPDVTNSFLIDILYSCIN